MVLHWLLYHAGGARTVRRTRTQGQKGPPGTIPERAFDDWFGALPASNHFALLLQIELRQDSRQVREFLDVVQKETLGRFLRDAHAGR